MVGKTTECRSCGGTVALTMTDFKDKCPHCGEKGPATSSKDVEKQQEDVLKWIFGMLAFMFLTAFIAFQFVKRF